MYCATSQPYYVLSTPKFSQWIYWRDGISHFFEFDSVDTYIPTLYAFPNGCIDILIPVMQPSDWIIIGPTTKSFIPVIRQNACYFGVRFTFGVIPSFLRLLPEDLKDQCLVMNSDPLYLNFATDFCKSLTFSERVLSFLKFYYSCEKFHEDNSSNWLILNQALNVIVQTHGTSRIEDLAREICYSPRTIQKCFRKCIGISPDKMCKLVRFQNFMFLLSHNNSRRTMTRLASAAGYYDQAHLIHDFENFTNMTPKAFYKIVSSSDYCSRLEDTTKIKIE